MAFKITNWNCVKIILFICDISLLLLNAILFVLITYIIYNEYYGRGTIRLFFIPFIVSLVNVINDIIMNKTNVEMKYAGHNRYGMIIRFFMFYFIIAIVSYSDQRTKYIKTFNNCSIKRYVFLFGIIDMGFLFLSMILSLFVIDVESFKQVFIKRRRRKTAKSLHGINSIQNIEIPDL